MKTTEEKFTLLLRKNQSPKILKYAIIVVKLEDLAFSRAFCSHIQNGKLPVLHMKRNLNSDILMSCVYQKANSSKRKRIWKKMQMIIMINTLAESNSVC